MSALTIQWLTWHMTSHIPCLFFAICEGGAHLGKLDRYKMLSSFIIGVLDAPDAMSIYHRVFLIRPCLVRKNF